VMSRWLRRDGRCARRRRAADRRARGTCPMIPRPCSRWAGVRAARFRSAIHSVVFGGIFSGTAKPSRREHRTAPASSAEHGSRRMPAMTRSIWQAIPYIRHLVDERASLHTQQSIAPEPEHGEHGLARTKRARAACAHARGRAAT
jgi:hypothetical protein